MTPTTDAAPAGELDHVRHRCAAPAGELDHARHRCAALRHRILHSLPSSKLPPPCRQTLLRLLDAEIRFLSRLPVPLPHPLTPNVGHLEALINVIHHPSILQISRLCKPIPSPSTSVHVDLICTHRRSPAWVLVSDRNPNHLSWLLLRARVERAVTAARCGALAMRPDSLLLVFARGLPADGDGGVTHQLENEFGAVEIDFWDDHQVFDEMEDGWVGVGAVFERARVFEIKVGGGCGGGGAVLESGSEMELKGEGFGAAMRHRDDEAVDVVNFDTTALVAMVSGISNGGTESMMRTPEEEMRRRFKGNYEFVMAQVMSELHDPIIVQFIAVVAGKKGIICESVCSEFKELVSMCGGPNEKGRAEELVKHLLVVPDSPSARVMDLPTTRKIALKNKIVFGTGDYWHAPTLTANMGFARAIAQTGMSLLTIEHRPRALTGD